MSMLADRTTAPPLGPRGVRLPAAASVRSSRGQEREDGRADDVGCTVGVQTAGLDLAGATLDQQVHGRGQPGQRGLGSSAPRAFRGGRPGPPPSKPVTATTRIGDPSTPWRPWLPGLRGWRGSSSTADHRRPRRAIRPPAPEWPHRRMPHGPSAWPHVSVRPCRPSLLHGDHSEPTSAEPIRDNALPEADGNSTSPAGRSSARGSPPPSPPGPATTGPGSSPAPTRA